MDNYGNTFKSTSIIAHFDFGQHTIKFQQAIQNSVDSRNSFANQPNGICIYVPASRDFSKQNDKRLQDMDFPYGQRLFIFDHNQENNFEKILVSLSSKEIQANHHKFASTKETATLQRIRSAYKIIFPAIDLIGAYGSVFLAKKNGSSFPISFLSHGEKQALILFTTLAKEPTLDESIVIIDEPEIGLAKEIRTNLTSALRSLSPSLQIIVATHSKEIIESVDPSKIVPLT
jgi:predicted ATP-binding protein involved in virulence